MHIFPPLRVQSVSQSWCINRIILLLVLMVLVFSSYGVAVAGELQLTSAGEIWNQAQHNAFTDITRFNGSLWTIFREGEEHVSPAGTLRVLESTDDGLSWQSAATVALPQWDLRDPHFSITPDNRLMINGGARQETGASDVFRSVTAFSPDGATWSTPQFVLEGGSVQENRWLWQTTWHEGTSYGIDYYTSYQSGNTARLLTSTDGLNYTEHASLLDTDWPTEATIRFANDGTAYALQRRDRGTKTTMLGTSQAPYTEWSWADLKVQFSGGPNLLQLPNGQWIAAGRIFDTARRTLLAGLDVEQGTLQSLNILPPETGTNSDAAYPGLWWENNTLWVSYYSTPSGTNARIDLAKFEGDSFVPTPVTTVIENVGDTDPTAGFVWGQGGATEGTFATDEESHVNLTVPGGVGYYYTNGTVYEDSVNDPSGWTATMRAKVLDTGSAPLFQSYLEVDDGTDVWYMTNVADGIIGSSGFYTTSASSNLEALDVTFDPSLAYHDYQMVYDPAGDGGNGLVTFYLDGNSVGTKTRAGTPNQNLNRLVWGDNSSAGSATHARYSLVRFETGQNPIIVPGITIIENIGDTDPTAGSVWGQGGSFTPAFATDEEAHVDMGVHAGLTGFYFTNGTTYEDGVSHPSGWTATMRAKVLDTGNTPLFQSYLEVDDGTDVWYMTIIADGILGSSGLYTTDASSNLEALDVTFDPSLAYHDYQMVFDPTGDSGNGLITFYLDGISVGTKTRADTPDQNLSRLVWGDNNGTGSGTQTQYSLIRFETGQNPITPGLSGDFDFDGDVDGNDFLVWQRGFGTIFDASDLADWESNYGATSGSGSGAAAAAVPEPASQLLLILGVGGLAATRRRKI